MTRSGTGSLVTVTRGGGGVARRRHGAGGHHHHDTHSGHRTTPATVTGGGGDSDQYIMCAYDVMLTFHMKYNLKSHMISYVHDVLYDVICI